MLNEKLQKVKEKYKTRKIKLQRIEAEAIAEAADKLEYEFEQFIDSLSDGLVMISNLEDHYKIFHVDLNNDEVAKLIAELVNRGYIATNSGCGNITIRVSAKNND